MGLTPEDVRSLIAAFDESDWTEMSLVVGDTTLELSRTGHPPRRRSAATATATGPATDTPDATSADTTSTALSAPTSAPQIAAPAPAAPSPAPGRAHHPEPGDDGQAEGQAGGRADGQVDGHAVTSPSVGLFWRSPQPGAPPFAEVGQHVEPDDTLCIVEVMKLMNHVKAGVTGTVRAVRAENGDMVEHGQTLFVVEPDA